MATQTEKVIGYLTANSGRHVTALELSEALGLTRQQAMGAVHYAKSKVAGITSVAHAVYRYDPSANGHRPTQASTVEHDDCLLVQVIVSNPERTLVRDENGLLWTMQRFDF